MQLKVTSQKGVYWLTSAIVVTATVAATLLALGLIRLGTPADQHHLIELLSTIAIVVTAITCVMIGTPFGLVVSLSLFKAHQLQQTITAMASIDPLTGLSNRAVILSQLQAALATCKARQQPGAVLFLDLDRFKAINDSFGHAGGDAALCHAASVLRTSLGPDAIVGRFGGEEFVCFIHDAGLARSKAEEIIEAFRSTSAVYERELIPVRASIGLATTDGLAQGMSDDRADITRLLSCADEALYAAKSSGRDRVVSYDEVAALRLKAMVMDPAAQREVRSRHPRSRVLAA